MDCESTEETTSGECVDVTTCMFGKSSRNVGMSVRCQAGCMCASNSSNSTRTCWFRGCSVAVPATADHEGVIVADVVAEWATRHGDPYVLDLTGEAGGHWVRGRAGEHLEMEASEFCRLLSGRGTGTSLMARHVPF